MVAIVHGSSHFTPIGATHVTGPTGATGNTGPTGPPGFGGIGPTGFSGGNIINMYIVDDDKLHTTFELRDGSTSTYTTTTRIKGPTGNAQPLIDGQNVNDSSLMGMTFVQGRNENDDINSFILRSIEVTGAALTLESNGTLGTIDIKYDAGNFGYLNIDGTDTDSVRGQLVGLSGSNLTGISGARYNRDVGASIESGSNAIDVRVSNFKEKTKYLTVANTQWDSGATADIGNYSPSYDDSPLYTPPDFQPINPNDAKIFILDMRQLEGVDSTGYTGEVSLHFENASFGYTGNGPFENSNADVELAKSFTLIVHGATSNNAYPPWSTNILTQKNIIWPLNLPPCWSGGTDILNFFWLPCDFQSEINCPKGHAWHGNVVQWHSATGGTDGYDNPHYCYNYDNTIPYNYADGGNYYFGNTGGTGACCMGKGTCVHTTEANCPGYYNGASTICGAGGTGSSCYELGPCCVRNTQSHEFACYDDMSANECVDMGDILNYHTLFGGTANTCDDMRCENLKNEIGACCDGLGQCEEVYKTNCMKQEKFFMGIGVPCSNKDGINICSGGTGACCMSGMTCSNNTSGLSCISDGYLYGGHGSHCRDINCIDDSTTSGCVVEVAGLNLQPGDLYAGGMVVGLYHPDGDVGMGAKGFGGSKLSSWESLMKGGFGSTSDNIGDLASTHKSKYDWHSYGFDSKTSCETHITKSDAYYMIVSLNPVGITGDRVVEYNDVDGITNEFYWGNRGSSWGPLYNQNLGTYDDISNEYKYKVFPTSEGYWYDQNRGNPSLVVLPEMTFSSCGASRIYGNDAISKLKTKPIQTAHGMWHRNWGLYNTIRIISADNALYKGYNDVDGAYTGSNFGPGLTSGYISAFRAVRLYNDDLVSLGITGSNPPNVSGWYLPSHDEFSYIAYNCTKESNNGFNLNSKLLEEDGTPINGWHWSSTGAYDETKGLTAGIGEGIINPVGATGPLGVTADPGSLAWAIKINQDGISNNFLVGKKNRISNKYKVRPIRLVRCDGRYPLNDDINYKLWKLPNVLRDEDKGINKRY